MLYLIYFSQTNDAIEINTFNNFALSNKIWCIVFFFTWNSMCIYSSKSKLNYNHKF